MQNQYVTVKKMEIELKQLEEITKIPKRPRKNFSSRWLKLLFEFRCNELRNFRI